MLILDFVRETFSSTNKIISATDIQRKLFQGSSNYYKHMESENHIPYISMGARSFFNYDDVYAYFQKMVVDKPLMTHLDFIRSCVKNAFCPSCPNRRKMSAGSRLSKYCSMECHVKNCYSIVDGCFIAHTPFIHYNNRTHELINVMYELRYNKPYPKNKRWRFKKCGNKHCVNIDHIILDKELMKQNNIITPTEDTSKVMITPKVCDPVLFETLKSFIKTLNRSYKNEVKCEITKRIIEQIATKCLANDYKNMPELIKLLEDIDTSNGI